MVGGYFCRSKLEYEIKVKCLVALSASQRPHKPQFNLKSVAKIARELFKRFLQDSATYSCMSDLAPPATVQLVVTEGELKPHF